MSENLVVVGRRRHFKSFSQPLLGLRMTQGIELEFQSQNRPSPVLREFDVEFAEGFEPLSAVTADLNFPTEFVDIDLGAVFEKGEEEVLLALEMAIERALGPSRGGSYFGQLRAIVAIAHEDLFCCFEQFLQSLLRAKVIPAYDLR